jgi:predicted O-linked N-acetylglucosamine transferase (SPINDLY family)
MTSADNTGAMTIEGLRDYISEKMQAGDNATAASLCKQVLLSFPQENPYFIKALSMCYQNLEEYTKAIDLLKQGVSLFPNDAELRAGLGYALYCNGDIEEGKEFLRHALRLDSNNLFVADVIAKFYFKEGKYFEAIPTLEYLAEQQPTEDHLQRLGVAYLRMQLWTKAEKIYTRVLEKNPTDQYALLNIYNAYTGQNKKQKAYETISKLVDLYPEYATHYAYYLLDAQGVSDWDAVKKARSGFESFYKPHRYQAMTPFAHVVSYDDPYENYQCARYWYLLQQHQGACAYDQFTVDMNAEKIKIGYVSRDFYNHATMHLLAGVFAHHDRSKFEIYIYSYGPETGDRYQKFLRQHCDAFYFMQHKNDTAMWDKIHKDGVHVLVDLKGQTNAARISLLDSRIAPVQVQYTGFPGTSGSDAMDYLITDKTVSPEAHAGYYSEKLAYMPHSYQSNDNQQVIGESKTRSEYGISDDAFVFASFNQDYKIDAEAMDVWAEILDAVPNSVLWLAHSNDMAVENLIKEGQKRGIAEERLFFYRGAEKAEHLARVQLADLALDTRLVNGHTSTSDCLWAGVPVITKIGNHFASRVSASLLHAIGLPELVTESYADYKRLAVDLATNSDKMEALKQRLEENKKTQPLYDSKGYTAHLEKLYTAMWQRYKDGKEPSSLHFNEALTVEECQEADAAAENQVMYLHWFAGTPNWGDILNPEMAEAISGKKPIYHMPNLTSQREFYLCTGSVLALANRYATVWGSGYISDTAQCIEPPKKICAVRGPLTRKKLLSQGIECPEVYGDPALLYPRFYQPKSVKKKYKLGIIPHYIDKENPWVLQQYDKQGIAVLNVQTEDLNSFVDAVLSCERVVSSSLHGLIVADAYGVPSLWARFSDQVIGGDFKFQDYFASVGRTEDKPLLINDPSVSLETVFSSFHDYNISIDLDALWEACPFRRD